MPTDDVEFTYTATSENPGRPRGFQTHSSTIDYGVNVQGNTAGLYGEALGNGPDSARSSQDGSRAGVWGAGDHYGVYGASNRLYNAAVIPPLDNTPFLSPDIATEETQFGAIGVAGASLTVPGVVGTSAITAEEFTSGSLDFMAGDILKNPVGVLGVTGSNEKRGSAGVAGISVADVTHEDLQLIKLNPAVKGLFGAQNKGDSVGVLGWSSFGRGGVFASAIPISNLEGDQSANRDLASAQIRLAPAPVSFNRKVKVSPLEALPSPTLPSDGQAGDLIAVNITDNSLSSDTATQTRLWFCIQSVSLDRTEPAIWAEVLLSGTIAGTRA